MAEAGCLYHTSWIVDDQPWPINVRGGQKFIFVPYTGQTNDRRDARLEPRGGLLPAMIKDQFDTLYREGAENGRVMPRDGADQLRKFDAILFGAVGVPDIPDHITHGACAWPSVRRSISTPTYARPDPARHHQPAAPCLRPGAGLGDRARELGGRVFRCRRRYAQGPADRAQDVSVMTRAGVQRIVG
jgi:isocitrate/isopropylmalate dehydrogenase